MTAQLFFLLWTILAGELVFTAKASLTRPLETTTSRAQRSELAISRAVAHSMRIGKIDYMLENMNRRIEAIETKLNHFEVRMDIRMEKIEEAVLAKDLKGEFATDQLSRQIDNMGEKVMNKIAFLEAKMGMRLETLNSRFERSERHLQHSLEGMLSKLGKTDDQHVQSESRRWTDLGQVEEINNSIQDLKSFISEEISDTVMKKLQDIGEKLDTGFQEVDTELEIEQTMVSDLKSAVVLSNNLTEESLKLLEVKLNNSCESESNRGRSSVQYSLRESVASNSEDINIFASKTEAQLDNITNTMGEALRMGERKFKELDNDVEIYTKKVLNAYYELLKASREMEQSLMSTVEQGNQTRAAVQDGFRRVFHLLRPLTGVVNRKALEPKIEKLVEGLETKIQDLSTTVDSSFATLLIAQNAFIASCHRIQQQEPQIESKIHDAIQKIAQERTSSSNQSTNDSSATDEDLPCRQGFHLNDVLWTILSNNNQTRNDMSALASQMTSLQRAIVTVNANSRCMIEAGDWTSLSQACSIMHGRAMIPNPINQAHAVPSAHGTNHYQNPSSPPSRTMTSHLADGNADSTLFVNDQHQASDENQRNPETHQWNRRLPSNAHPTHDPPNTNLESASTQKHSTRNFTSENSERTNENSNKAHADYESEEEYLDDYPDQ